MSNDVKNLQIELTAAREKITMLETEIYQLRLNQRIPILGNPKERQITIRNQA